MADKPILFSAPMVRALLAGTKTQTRRAIPEKIQDAYYEYDDWCSNVSAGVPSTRQWEREFFLERLRIQPGDRLYVRETIGGAGHRGEAVGYPADGSWLPNTPWEWARRSVPSIHMPRRLSRITLTVTDVRVERLQDCSEADALAEGMTQATAEAIMGPDELAVYAATHIVCPEARGRILYETIWNHINGPGSWEANPWVAAYTFTVHHGNIDQMGGE